MSDQNFNDLMHKFTHNIYGTIKGTIRLAVLLRDLHAALPLKQQKLRILDAGGGLGQLSQTLAALGHEVVLCDISEELLTQAQQQINQATPPLDISLIHCAIQDLPISLGQFDLILCHAVLEWLDDGEQTLASLQKFLTPNGYLSLMFYNLDAQRFHALVCGNFSYIDNGLKAKKTVRLTPQHAYCLPTIRQWFNDWHLDEQCVSGVRVINDYLKAGAKEQITDEALIEMELRYSAHPSYVPIGRYIHILGQRNSSSIKW